MAYEQSALRMVSQAGFDSGSVWIYGPQPDPHATCEEAGYFTNGGTLGMRVGDLVFVIESSAGGTTCHSVTAVAAAPAGSSDKTPGAATISAGEFS